MKRITNYNPRNITSDKISKHKQDANNCWLYASLNCLYHNTWLTVNIPTFKKYLSDKRISTQYSNVWYTWCEQLVKYNNKIEHYWFDALEHPELLAKLWLKWYFIVATRINNYELLYDIMNDDDVDIVPPKKWTRHVVCYWFNNKKVTEYWTWWDDNRYNQFTFDNIDLFIKCIKAWVIDSVVRFLDYKQ